LGLVGAVEQVNGRCRIHGMQCGTSTKLEVNRRSILSAHRSTEGADRTPGSTP
jgi:hypothetical protein